MSSLPLTRVTINLTRLDQNMNLLQELAGGRTLWPAIKANAYGHGGVHIARRLLSRGFSTLCVAHAAEALDLIAAGVGARFVILSPDLGDTAEDAALNGLEPVVATVRQLKALSAAAVKHEREIRVHLKIDTGMGRVGFLPGEAAETLQAAFDYPGIRPVSVMSHFPRADEEDKEYSKNQLELFRRLAGQLRASGIEQFHLANSAAIFDLPDARFDICRPGIAIYGLRPSETIQNPRVSELQPVLEWVTAITQLKKVPAGTGLSYGHTFVTSRESLIASVPVGYGDGLMRLLSNRMDFLVRGIRCPQVGRICMDQCLIDVSALKGRVSLGEEAVLIGSRGNEEIGADEMADTLGTINYEIVTAISARVPRIILKED